MAKELFRKKCVEKVSSPDELNDYLKVVSPRVWLVLSALFVLLLGGVLWICLSKPELLAFFVN